MGPIGPDEFFNKLTRRQRQICALVALALDSREIASVLRIGVPSVNKQIIEAKSILDLSDRTKLAVHIVRIPSLEKRLRATLPPEIFAKNKTVTP